MAGDLESSPPANKTGIRCRKSLHRMQQLSKSGKNSSECQTSSHLVLYQFYLIDEDTEDPEN